MISTCPGVRRDGELPTLPTVANRPGGGVGNGKSAHHRAFCRFADVANLPRPPACVRARDTRARTHGTWLSTSEWLANQPRDKGLSLPTSAFEVGNGWQGWQRMRWRRAGKHHSESDAGYAVSVARVGDEKRYTAWAPKEEYSSYKRRLKVRYGPGESVPQQSERIGTFSSGEAAAAACEEHQQRGGEDERGGRAANG